MSIITSCLSPCIVFIMIYFYMFVRTCLTPFALQNEKELIQNILIDATLDTKDNNFMSHFWRKKLIPHFIKLCYFFALNYLVNDVFCKGSSETIKKKTRILCNQQGLKLARAFKNLKFEFLFV